jgi:hypothetical protein
VVDPTQRPAGVVVVVVASPPSGSRAPLSLRRRTQRLAELAGAIVA